VHDNKKKRPGLIKRYTADGSLVVWAHFVSMTITTSKGSAEYQSHPRDTLVPVWKELSSENGILMQNNARYYVSRDSMDWLCSQNISTMNCQP